LGNNAEFVKFDVNSGNVFISNPGASRIDAVQITFPNNPSSRGSIDISSYGSLLTSIDISSNVIAASVVPANILNKGVVALFSTTNNNGFVSLGSINVGYYPNFVAFSPDGTKLVVANKGEPNADYTQDPIGTVSIITLVKKGTLLAFTEKNINDLESNFNTVTVDFSSYNNVQLDPYIRSFSDVSPTLPNNAEDLAPTSVAITPDSAIAWVILQENNAAAQIDLRTNKILSLKGFTFLDYSLPALSAGFDASDLDGKFNNETNTTSGAAKLRNYVSTWGLPEPSQAVAFSTGLGQYVITANEGTQRSFTTYQELALVNSLNLDPAVFNTTKTQDDSRMGRLSVSTLNADSDGDDLVDTLYVPGTRSFSIFRASDGSKVYDSTSDFEQYFKDNDQERYNLANYESESFDWASISKGPQPCGVAVGIIDQRAYAFVTLNSIGGFFMYDVASPSAPYLIGYFDNRDVTFNTTLNATNFDLAGDLGAKGISFIPANNSPNRIPLVVVANQVSGTTSIWQLHRRDQSSVYVFSAPSSSAPVSISVSVLVMALLAALMVLF